MMQASLDRVRTFRNWSADAVNCNVQTNNAAPLSQFSSMLNEDLPGCAERFDGESAKWRIHQVPGRAVSGLGQIQWSVAQN